MTIALPHKPNITPQYNDDNTYNTIHPKSFFTSINDCCIMGGEDAKKNIKYLYFLNAFIGDLRRVPSARTQTFFAHTKIKKCATFVPSDFPRTRTHT